MLKDKTIEWVEPLTNKGADFRVYINNESLGIPLIVKSLDENGNFVPDAGFGDEALSKLIVDFDDSFALGGVV